MHIFALILLILFFVWYTDSYQPAKARVLRENSAAQLAKINEARAIVAMLTSRLDRGIDEQFIDYDLPNIEITLTPERRTELTGLLVRYQNKLIELQRAR